MSVKIHKRHVFEARLQEKACLADYKLAKEHHMQQNNHKVYQIVGDGNCFYRSMLIGMRASGTWPSEVWLRKKDARIAAVLRKEGLLVPLHLFKGTDEQIIQWLRYACMSSILREDTFQFADQTRGQCIQSTIQMGVYADHLQIAAFAKALRINIVVLHLQGTIPTVVPSQSKRPYICILYNSRNEHFNAVVPSANVKR